MAGNYHIHETISSIVSPKMQYWNDRRNAFGSSFRFNAAMISEVVGLFVFSDFFRFISVNSREISGLFTILHQVCG
jgi:hypothetical protein